MITTEPILSLPAEIDAFLAEVRVDAALAPVADGIETAFRAIDLEGDGVPDAICFLEGVTWIVEHKNRTVRERFDAIEKYAEDRARFRA